jgi:hypothetical protein
LAAGSILLRIYEAGANVASRRILSRSDLGRLSKYYVDL